MRQEMNKIKCQNCSPTKDEGCYKCGGYKVILIKSKCDGCRKVYWTNPGVYTVYEGKEFVSFDGLKLVYKLNGTFCQRCAL